MWAILSPELQERVQAWKEYARTVSVEDQESYDAASRAIRGFKDLEVDIASAHKDAKAPILKLGRAIDGIKKHTLGVLKSFRYGLSSKMQTWKTAAEREARAKQAELETAIQKHQQAQEMKKAQDDCGVPEIAQVSVPEVPNIVVPPAPTTGPSTATRRTRQFEVLDETKVPRELCSPDSKKIRQYLKNLSEEQITQTDFQNLWGIRMWIDTTEVPK